MQVRFLEPAVSEFDDAVRYYEEQMAGLGAIFRKEFVECLQRVLQFPEAYQRVGQHSRRALLSRFPYGLIYQARPKQDLLLIVAVAHLHRRPDYWVHRTPPADN